ncbi:glycosyltransferase family 4 protein [Fusobacterium periodonticum]|uniref:Glycosyltransferase, group 1 family protein n=1 Tax=Fusobacterium periodonticum ATCC 33693 TaxID=546275 RepID=D4CUC9_9FUSO|nr:glycosyltransferase family 4 protein [Fusobacterium periodonticum]EFE87080.1 glycosyltransferase, group 1 family protein [Fusobacterium periodonticum ATCC 33693]
MNILYLSAVPFKIDKNPSIYTDLIQELDNFGDQITVVSIDSSLKPFQIKKVRKKNIDLIYIGSFQLYNVNLFKKGLSILSLPFFMRRAIKKLDLKKFEVILYETPPITWAGIVKQIKKKNKIKSFLMLKDIFPQNAVDIGLMKKNGLIFKYFKRKEKLLYEVSDYIGCMSNGNIDYVLENNPEISKEKVYYFPNTKKDTGNGNIDFKKEKLQFVYGGNMGLPQGVLNIAPAISYFKNDRNIEFIFVGKGTEWNKINEYFKEQKNVKVLESLPREEYEKLLSSCDAGFILLDSRFTIPNYPSRTLAYLEKGIPIIAATDRNTDIKDLIQDNNVGLWSYSDDIDSLIKNIKIMKENKENRKEFSKNARELFLKEFQVEKSVELLHKYINNN